MAVITVTNDLDVVNKYNQLVKESLDGESVYIRTKETLQELFETSNFTSREKSEILANILGSLNTTLVNASMSTAMQWANQEKEIELKKLELAKQLDILDEDILLKQAQIDKMKADDIAQQAQTIRMYGTPTVVDGNVVALTDTGKVYEDIQLVKEQVVNAGKEGVLLDAKKVESQAAVHKVIADTYRNYGSYSYTIDDSGLIANRTDTTTTLSDIQEAIAKEQAKGYAYNAWANSLSGSASMLGTAIAAEYAEFGAGQPGGDLLDNVILTASKLKDIPVPVL